MQRTPEPELMTGEAQARAYAAADFSAGDQALVQRLLELFPAGLGDVLLDWFGLLFREWSVAFR